MNTINNTNDSHRAIQEWANKEEKERISIAASYSGLNTKCPICGKAISVKNRANGAPLTTAKVCSECDKRYVYMFRLLPLSVEYAPKYLKHCMDAELLIQIADKFNSHC